MATYMSATRKFNTNTAVRIEDRLRLRTDNSYMSQRKQIQVISRLKRTEAIFLNIERRKQSIRGWLKVKRSQVDRGLSSNEPINQLKIINFGWPTFSIIRPPTFLQL